MSSQDANSMSAEPESAFFRRWAEVVLRYRWLAIALVAGVTAFAVVQIKKKLIVDNSMEAFLSSQSDAMRKLEEFRDVFGRDDLFMVMVEGDVFSMAYLEKLKALHGELATVPSGLEST